MFERGDDMMTVAAERAMIAVMQHYDVAAPPTWTRHMSEPLDQAPGRLRLPVPANFRPHHHALHSRAPYFRAQQRTPVTVRRPHPARRRCSRRRGNRVLAAGQFASNFRAGFKNQTGMSIRVIADQVAARGNFPAPGPGRRAQICRSGKMSRAPNGFRTIQGAAE